METFWVLKHKLFWEVEIIATEIKFIAERDDA